MTESPHAFPARIAEEAGAILDGGEDLLRLLPYAKAAIGAYELVRRRRLVSFLRVLDYEISRKGEEARRRIDEALKSDEGADLVADFADAAIRSSSRLVGATLAVLYTDHDDSAYPPALKARICVALDRLADRSVEVFLLLTDVVPTDRAAGEEPWLPVYDFDNLLSRKPEIGSLAATPGDQAAIVEDLQSRGLLLRDPSSTFGGTGGSGITYGIEHFGERVRATLLRAKAILPAVKE